MLMSMSVPLAALAFFPCFFLFIVVQMDDTELQQFYDEFFEEVYVELEKVGPIAPTPIYICMLMGVYSHLKLTYTFMIQFRTFPNCIYMSAI